MRKLIAALSAAGLAACAAPGGTGSGGAATPSPLGTRWVAEVEGLDAAQRPRLEFVTEGRVSGYTGCNMLSGTWRMEGGEIVFGAIAATKRFCLGPGGEAEKRLLAALGSESRGRREGNRLVLVAPGGARFELVAAAS